LRRVEVIQIGLIGAVGLLLAARHGVEAALWAAAYWWLGALNSPTDAILYSVDSMSSRGASGLTLVHHQRLMSALEAMDGMPLFGISTAYIFAMMQAYWSLMTRRGHPSLGQFTDGGPMACALGKGKKSSMLSPRKRRSLWIGIGAGATYCCAEVDRPLVQKSNRWPTGLTS